MKITTLPGTARLHRCVLLAGLAAVAGLPLTAAARDGGALSYPGFSIGGGAGSNSLNGADYTGNGNRVKDTQVSYKGMAGYRLSDVVSLEAQYIDFGTAEDGANSVDAHGVTAGALFEAPMSRHIHPYAKAGALFWDADGQFSGVNRSETGTDFTYGGGLRFLLSRHFDVRTEYERFEFTDADVHTISAMLQFNF